MKIKGLTLRRVLIAFCACGMVAIATATAIMIAGLSAVQGSVGLNGYAKYYIGGAKNGTEQTHESLFREDGINPHMAFELCKALNMALATKGITDDFLTYTGAINAQDFSNFVTNGDIGQQGGIYLRLFDSYFLGTSEEMFFTTSLHPDHGLVGAGRYWRPVYLQNGILTLWMAEPYRGISMGKITTAAPVVMDALALDFTGMKDGTISASNGVLSNYPKSVHNAIVKTSSVASHKSQPTTNYNSSAFNNPDVADKYLAWLPSLYEVMGPPSGTPFWGVRNMDRAFIAGVSPANSWLRSASSYSWSDYTNHYASVLASDSSLSYPHGYSWVNPSGVGSYSTSAAMGIRPAIHINMSTIASNAAAPHINAEVE